MQEPGPSVLGYGGASTGIRLDGFLGGGFASDVSDPSVYSSSGGSRVFVFGFSCLQNLDGRGIGRVEGYDLIWPALAVARRKYFLAH